MARQNIDEQWKTDPRRTLLAERIGGRNADGMRVEINWLLLDHKGLPIPLKKFQFVKDWQAWVDCGLAEVKGDLVHVAGADAYAEFFAKQKANGLKPKKTTRSQRKPNEAKESQTKPNKPSFSSSSSFSGSNSSSDSGSSISNSSNSTPKVSDFVAAYCDRFKARWNEPAPIMGKDAGIAKRLAGSLSLERFKVLLDAYFSMPDAWLVKQKHPLNLFEAKLNEIVVFSGQGKFTTAKEVRQADDMATNMALLQKIRGEK
jgi:hypothetical protein